MKNRKLGLSNLNVSPICLGGNVFGWTVNERDSFQLLDEFFSRGFNFIDTADVYSFWHPGNQGGESETILGKWLKKSKNRNQVVIATKVGIDISTGKNKLTKKHIFQSVENSLKRLKTDYIDLYQSHKDDLDTPVEETLDAYSQLIKQGKILYIGASNYTADRFTESINFSKQNNIPQYQSLQPLYNLYDREEYEKNLEPLCLKEKVGVINFYSLASGFLSGKYRIKEDLLKYPRGERVEKYLNDRGLRILNALDIVSKQYNTFPSNISLAWLLSRESVTSPIVSATNLKQLAEIINSVELKLDKNYLDFLNKESAY